jgi:hypothetical protein
MTSLSVEADRVAGKIVKGGGITVNTRALFGIEAFITAPAPGFGWWPIEVYKT